MPLVNDNERRRRADTEALNKVRSLGDLDAVDNERLVVPATLQDLGEVAVYPARFPVAGVIENQEARLGRRLLGHLLRPTPSHPSHHPSEEGFRRGQGLSHEDLPISSRESSQRIRD
jgi:hypothetical protein